MEEFGWRGYLQNEFSYLKPIKKYFLIGFIWYLWHLSFLTNTIIKDNLFFCAVDQVYLYKRTDTWKSFGDRCFVAPIKETDVFSNKKEKELVGILKYSNKSLEAFKIAPGDLIGFTPDSEFEFTIDGEKLYCMKSNDIVIKYEYKGDEEKYNPSWAKSS